MGKSVTNWRQIKFFGISAHGVLNPDSDFKSADLAGLFGMEPIEVEKAHTEAAKAEVASWEKQPVAVEKMKTRIAWWLAFGDALGLTGIGPHKDESPKKKTGLSPAIDYAARVKRRDDISPTAKAKGFLDRLGLKDGYKKDEDGVWWFGDHRLPVGVVKERVGGNGFGAIEAKTEAPPVPQTVAAPGDGKLEELAKALKAAGFSLPEIVAALKAA
jgi:hypothetical protein